MNKLPQFARASLLALAAMIGVDAASDVVVDEVADYEMVRESGRLSRTANEQTQSWYSAPVKALAALAIVIGTVLPPSAPGSHPLEKARPAIERVDNFRREMRETVVPVRIHAPTQLDADRLSALAAAFNLLEREMILLMTREIPDSLVELTSVDFRVDGNELVVTLTVSHPNISLEDMLRKALSQVHMACRRLVEEKAKRVAAELPQGPSNTVYDSAKKVVDSQLGAQWTFVKERFP